MDWIEKIVAAFRAPEPVGLRVSCKPDLVTGAFVPKDYEFQSLDQYAEAPRRIRRTLKMASVDAFCRYIKEFKEDGTEVHQEEWNVFVANLDGPMPNQPSWCEHRVSLQLQMDPHFEAWCKISGNRLSQRAFADFIMDHSATVADPDLNDLLQAVESVEVASDGGEVYQDRGQRKAVRVNKTRTIKSEIPKLTIVTPVVKHGDPYRVPVRLQCWANEGEVAWQCEMVNREDVLLDVAQSVRNFIVNDTGVVPYY